MAKSSKKPDSKGGKGLQFKVDFDQKFDQELEIAVYAFGRDGKLLTSAPVDDGEATLNLSPEKARGTRIFVAPVMPGRREEQEIRLSDMERWRGYEPVWYFDLDRHFYELEPIPEELWQWWFECTCRVRGRVVKPVLINGTWVDKPVCDARVHICEVDKLYWLIPRLPDDIIWRLRKELLIELQHPIPRPLPDPPLFTPIPLPDPPEIRFRNFEEPTRLDPEPELARIKQSQLERLQPQVLAGLSASSVQIVKKTLVANVELLWPYLCYWPWIWPYFCWCDELTVVTTDHTGKFDTTITYPCFGDKPDLYFWVEYLIDGTWTNVYHPPVCCYTYWDFVCGSEVTIRVYDDRVPYCEPIPDLDGLQVIITTIGNNISMSEIQHLSGAGQGFTTADNPFATTLEIRMDASRSNLIAAGVTHYRWSYRRLTYGDGTLLPTPGPWKYMTKSVDRHYKIMIPDPDNPGEMKPHYPTEKMGPDNTYPGDYLFRIQPATPDDPSAVEWSVLNQHIDLAWAYFQTGDLVEPDENGILGAAAGKYELKLELFDTTGSTPQLVNWSDPGREIDLFMSSNPAPFGPPTGMSTAAAGSNNQLLSGGDLFGYKMVLHVDNFKCEADIYETEVHETNGDITAAGPCGFIRYKNKATSDARLSFRAYHPYNHATFRFTVVKGSTGIVGIATVPAGEPVDSPSPNGYNRNSLSEFSQIFNVADLLNANGSTCDEAAFAETLKVKANARNGYGRVEALDASAIPMAFALAPKHKPPAP
jgi:hypothetical protein